VCVASIALALFTAGAPASAQGEPWPMPECAVEKLRPLLSSDVAAVRREALLQMVPAQRTRTFAEWHPDVLPLGETLARALADAALDADPEVAATAATVLKRVVFAVGEPVDVVARWAERLAPASPFAHDVASALAAADTRWPVDAVLERVQAERKLESPAVPPALLDLAAAILLPQTKEVVPAGTTDARRIEMFEYEAEPESPPPPVAPPQPFAEIPEPLLERLSSKDPDVSNEALLEIERTISYAQPLRGALLPRLAEAATRTQEHRWWYWLSLIERCELDADPAPLVDLWRAWHARRLQDGIRYLVYTIVRRGAKAEAVLRVLVREGDDEVWQEIARNLGTSELPFGKSPVGDDTLTELIVEHPIVQANEDACVFPRQSSLLSALERHPAVVKRVLPQLDPWLDGKGSGEVLDVLVIAGEEAAPLLPHVLRCWNQDSLPRWHIAQKLSAFGPSAIAPLSERFDRVHDGSDEVDLAKALLSLGARKADAVSRLIDVVGRVDTYEGTCEEALLEAARVAPDDPRVSAAARDLLPATQGLRDASQSRLRRSAWIVLARHARMAVDDDGLVRPG
jgi:hypothetical protein